MTVWGLDPSTTVIAIAVHDGKRIRMTSLRAIAQGGSSAERLASAVSDLAVWFRGVVELYGRPEIVVLEQPFGQGRRVHPQSQYMVAAVQIALVAGVGRTVDVRMLGPGKWKNMAYGAPHGTAGKPKLMQLAMEHYPADMTQDEADAVGMALAAHACV